jgi:type IV pilus assembly protein PilO
MRFGLRELVFIVLLIAMPVASYFFIFEPRNRQRSEARTEIMKKQQKLKQLEQATRSIDDLGQEIDRLTEAIQVFEQKLPAEREVEVILKQVSELATKHRLTTKSIRTDKTVESAQYSRLPIKIVILGDFDAYYSFLLELERLSRITQLPTMKLKKLDNEEGQMQAEIIMDVFFESTAQPAHASAIGSR